MGLQLGFCSLLIPPHPHPSRYPPSSGSYFGDAQMPAKTQQTLKGDEIEVKLESDGGKDRVFKLTHKALQERKDEQELWRAIRTRQRNKEREKKTMKN